MTPKTILTPERESLWSGLWSPGPWESMWRSRRLIRGLAARRLLERFRGSYLGAAWVFVLPLLMLAVYAFAFVGLLKIGGIGASTEKNVELTFSIFCGLIAYSVFSETAQRSVGCITGQPQFVKKVVFPLDALPVVALGESLVLAASSVLMLLLGTALLLGRAYPSWLLLPLPLFALSLVSLGFGWLLAALGVFVRDLGQMLTVALQMLFFLTPVCYPFELVPESLRPVMLLNPLVVVIESMRAMVLRGEAPMLALLWVVVAGAVLAQVGHAVFVVMRRRFADVL